MTQKFQVGFRVQTLEVILQLVLECRAEKPFDLLESEEFNRPFC
jgi:hypothetical protein